MSDNSVPIVFFGPAHAGKSTLIGYLISNFRQDVDAGKINQQVKREYPSHYDPAQYYAYIVDEFRSERMRGAGSMGLGTSKFIHLHRVSMRLREQEPKDFMLIDTPGSTQHFRDRIAGLSLGEIGVFVIPIDLVESNLRSRSGGSAIGYSDRLRFSQLIEPLDLWMNFSGHSGNRQSIVYLSKLDRAGQNPDGTVAAVQAFLEEHHGLGKVSVTGGSISVRERASDNITEEGKWTDLFGHTLLERLNLVHDEILTEERRYLKHTETAWCVVDRKLRLSDSQKPAIRCKIASGSLKKEDEVWLGPIHAGPSLDRSVEAFSISHLYRVLGGDTPDSEVDIAREGEIVNLTFRGSRFNEFELDRSSIVVLHDHKPELRREIRLLIAGADSDDLREGGQIALIWTGKVTWVVVRGINGDRICVEPTGGAEQCFLIPSTLSEFPGLSNAIISLDSNFRKTFSVQILG